MTNVRFATCDPVMARRHIRKLYPNADPEKLDALTASGPFIEFVKADVIRIPDPDFHSGEIIPSKKFEETMRSSVHEACAAFHAAANELCSAHGEEEKTDGE